jgi:hypothetical protein
MPASLGDSPPKFSNGRRSLATSHQLMTLHGPTTRAIKPQFNRSLSGVTSPLQRTSFIRPNTARNLPSTDSITLDIHHAASQSVCCCSPCGFPGVEAPLCQRCHRKQRFHSVASEEESRTLCTLPAGQRWINADTAAVGSSRNHGWYLWSRRLLLWYGLSSGNRTKRLTITQVAIQQQPERRWPFQRSPALSHGRLARLPSINITHTATPLPRRRMPLLPSGQQSFQTSICQP